MEPMAERRFDAIAQGIVAESAQCNSSNDKYRVLCALTNAGTGRVGSPQLRVLSPRLDWYDRAVRETELAVDQLIRQRPTSTKEQP